MKILLAACRLVDAISAALGGLAAVAVLAACLISAGNAVVRYAWDLSSNAWLEIQWYLFAVAVMFGAPEVLRRNEHVRVDILYSRLAPRAAAWLDLFGLALFLLPVMALLAVLSWPLFLRAYESGEVSGNAGGLVRWPVLLTLPVGFAWVCIQALAELVKRLAVLRGEAPASARYEKPLQ